MMEPNVSFLSNWILPLISRAFLGDDLKIYDSLHFGTKKHFNVFCFSFAEIWFSDWVHLFLHQYQKKMQAFFCEISAGLMAFRWKIVAVNLNSQQKFYGNGVSPVLRRLTAESAELSAILEK